MILMLMMIFSMIDSSESLDQCTSSSVRDCTWPIGPYVYTRQAVLLSDFNSIFCSNFANIKRCHDALGCSESDPDFVTEWQGYRDSFGYLCSDNSTRDVFFKDRCLRGPSPSQNNYYKCEVQFASEPKETDETSCSAYNSVVKCTQEAFKVCDISARRIQATFQYKDLKPKTTLINNCTFNKQEVMFSAGVAKIPAISLLIAMSVYSHAFA